MTFKPIEKIFCNVFSMDNKMHTKPFMPFKHIHVSATCACCSNTIALWLSSAVEGSIDRSSLKRKEAKLGRWAPGGAVQPPLLNAVA